MYFFVISDFILFLCYQNLYIMSTAKKESILDKVNLNWTVRTEKVRTETGIELPSYSAIIRNDTNVPLSIRSDSYYPYQNHELLELLEKVSRQTGLPIHKGGYFGDGERVYIQLKSNDMKLGKDKIEGYITGINSFDGSTSLAFGNTSLTISCQNTFFAAMREVQNKVRHTRYMSNKIDEICRTLEDTLESEKKMFKDIKKLSEIRVSPKVKDLVSKMLFNIDTKADLKDMEAISKVTFNKLSRFYVDLDGEITQKGDNLWGLFSGVTKFTTHSLTQNADKNTERKMFGTYGERERKIFKELLTLV